MASDSSSVPAPVRVLAERLAQLRPMRRGSLSERYVKCSKPGCACSQDPAARHGPYYSVSRVVAGRTQSRWLDAAHVDTVRRQIEEGQQFREDIEAYWQACERWADAELESPEAASKRAAEKKGSKPQSRPRSARKSKGS